MDFELSQCFSAEIITTNILWESHFPLYFLRLAQPKTNLTRELSVVASASNLLLTPFWYQQPNQDSSAPHRVTGEFCSSWHPRHVPFHLNCKLNLSKQATCQALCFLPPGSELESQLWWAEHPWASFCNATEHQFPYIAVEHKNASEYGNIKDRTWSKHQTAVGTQKISSRKWTKTLLSECSVTHNEPFRSSVKQSPFLYAHKFLC